MYQVKNCYVTKKQKITMFVYMRHVLHVMDNDLDLGCVSVMGYVGMGHTNVHACLMSETKCNNILNKCEKYLKYT